MNLLDKIDFFGGSRLPALIQSEAAECGLACLAMIASFHGYETDLIAMRRKFSISMKGTTLKDVLTLAQRLGMTGRGLRLEPEQLKHVKTPCILHWDMDHFVVLKEVSRSRVVIHDPAFGVRSCTLEEVGRHFTGIALELIPTNRFEKKQDVAKLALSAFWGRVKGMNRALVQALVLSAACR